MTTLAPANIIARSFLLVQVLTSHELAIISMQSTSSKDEDCLFECLLTCSTGRGVILGKSQPANTKVSRQSAGKKAYDDHPEIPGLAATGNLYELS